MHNQPAASACAQHIVQSSDHPNIEFSEAKRQVLRFNESTAGDEGDDPEAPEGDTMDISPPGGTTTDVDEDPARTMPDVPNTYNPRCPECGQEMTPTTDGVTYTGYYDGEEITITTDGNDHRCKECRILLTEDKATVTGLTHA